VRGNMRTLAIWAIAIGSIFLLVAIQGGQNRRGTEISFSEMLHNISKLDEMDDGLAELRVKGMDWRLSLNNGNVVYTTTGVLTDDFVNGLVKDHPGLVVHVDKADDESFWQSFLISWLPTLLLLGFFLFFLRNLQAGGGKAMSFGKSKAKMLTEGQNDITFASVAGCDEAKSELEEVVHFLRDPRRFTRLGGKLPKGVLLMGSPGTGKTLLAKAVAGEAGVPFFTISGSDFVEMFVGVGASRVRDLFEQAKRHAPCIIFIDEIDAVGRHRGAGMGGGHDEREQTLNQLLVEMDGFESNDGIILIAATNRPDVLDPALLRPGRFDRRVVVPLPDIVGREAILRVHCREVPLSPVVDISVIARSTPGFSGADLANLVNEAALIAAMGQSARVEVVHFEEARDKITMGAARKSMVMSEEAKRATAVHEAGHAVIAFYTEDADPLHKVTIIPHGRALGVTMQVPEEDRYSVNLKDNRNLIKILMGGYLAESMFYGVEGTTSGVSNDLQRAKQIATRMVKEFGMSSLGPVFYGTEETSPFLGREMGRGGLAEHSDETAREIDNEVRGVIQTCLEEARNLLNEKRDKLELLADSLMEWETLSGEQVTELFEVGNLPPRPKAPPEDEGGSMADSETEAESISEDPTVSGIIPDPNPA